MSEPDALLHDFQSITEPLRLEELFTQPQPTELEIGCGDGGFLLEYAQRHPERNFLGVERLLGRVRKLSKRGQHAGLNNLRLLRIEARYVLDYLLPERAFSAVGRVENAEVKPHEALITFGTAAPPKRLCAASTAAS